MSVLAHIAVEREDVEKRGATRVRDEALAVLKREFDKAMRVGPLPRGRVLRFKLIEEDRVAG